MPIRAHFLKMQIPQVAMAFKIYCLKITDTHREKGGHLGMEEFYFCLGFFARTVVRLPKGRCPHSQSRLRLYIWTVTLKESYEAFFQGYFGPCTLLNILLIFFYFLFFIYLTHGAQRTTLILQVTLLSRHHLSSRLTVLGK